MAIRENHLTQLKTGVYEIAKTLNLLMKLKISKIEITLVICLLGHRLIHLRSTQVYPPESEDNAPNNPLSKH